MTPGPYYHGTNRKSAASIVTEGIMDHPARHSSGHMGDVSGFYMTPSAQYAREFDEAVVEIRFGGGGLLGGGVEVLDAGAHRDGARPTRRPEWWVPFRNWMEDKVRDAAVWEIADTDRSPEEIVQSAIDDIDPENGGVDSNQDYSEKVARFAEDKGYDLLRWNDTETVLINFDAPSEIAPHNEAAKEAVESSF